MFGICFQGEPTEDGQSAWAYLAQGANATLYQRGVGDYTVKNAQAVKRASELPGTPVLVQPETGRVLQGSTSLKYFVHPSDAVYFFGGNHTNLSTDEFDLPDAPRIYVPNIGEQFAITAAGAVIWDRAQKLISNG